MGLSIEEKKLLINIDRKLDRICNYIDKIQSPEYIQRCEEREFLINVAADVYVEMMEDSIHNNRRSNK